VEHLVASGASAQRVQYAEDWFRDQLRRDQIEMRAQQLMEEYLLHREGLHRARIRPMPPPMRTMQEVLNRRATFRRQAMQPEQDAEQEAEQEADDSPPDFSPEALRLQARLVALARLDLSDFDEEIKREEDSVVDALQTFGMPTQDAENWYSARRRQYNIEMRAQGLMEHDVYERLLTRPPMRTLRQVLELRDSFLPEATREDDDHEARLALARVQGRRYGDFTPDEIDPEIQRQAQARLQRPQCNVM
jgi:hypothetical protein